jgi:hypothetical protein
MRVGPFHQQHGTHCTNPTIMSDRVFSNCAIEAIPSLINSKSSLSFSLKMARRILLLVLLVLLAHETWSGKDGEQCAPSSCGNIQNISYPFALKGDPETCGDPRYRLSCENNQTVLYLYAGKYNVREINYRNFLIQVSDSGIQENDNHSFIPRYFLRYENFTSGDPYDVPRTEPAVFVNCKKPASSRYGLYVNISACFINSSKRYGYVLDGTSLNDVEDTCQVEQISLMSMWFYAEEDNNISCSDVHNRLIYGFELSWPYQVYCGNCTGRDDRCRLDYANNVRCYNYTAHNGAQKHSCFAFAYFFLFRIL